jgi:UDP-N-acetylglucosamine--N-acetylmuramyl-(pentapeptide) pyrophosphoryl-undecaprenol N-acetylglucosamine transferase
MRVAFAAGGTGGHLYPAIAIADALRARGDTVWFVGTRDRLEARLVPAAGYQLCTISAHPLRRRVSFDLALTVARNALGVVQALRALARIRPDVVVATGGYVCVPVVVAARLRRLLVRRTPIALLEPNAVAGVATRLLAPLADDVWGESSTGTPVRATLLRLPRREDAARRLGLDPNRKTLFAFGASQGARSINDAVIALVLGNGIPQGWQVLLLAGDRDFDRVRAALGERAVVRAYLDDPADAYAVADLVLARAGASTLAELSAVRVPAILVPYPHAAEAHQAANAAAAAARGSAVVVDDADLERRLRGVLADAAEPGRLAAMRAASPVVADPTQTIVARIDALVSRS